ncbi:MICAL-like protein 1 isoform X2 [Topomyia yanbarensis]|nr:MICAL-like protein 1 isoform X2 [Topomyia yanbarensis]
MVKYEVPDRFSILTYLSQYYRVFSNQEPTNNNKKTTEKQPKSEDFDPKMANSSGFVGVPKREPCRACGNPVFFAERISFEQKLFHRSCLKCARCGAQLTLGSFYETETDGEYCCETCPDEEIQLAERRRSMSSESGVTSTVNGGSRENVRISRSSKLLERISFFESAPLSDEEKTSKLVRRAQMSSFLKGSLGEENKLDKTESREPHKSENATESEGESDSEDEPPAPPISAPPAPSISKPPALLASVSIVLIEPINNITREVVLDHSNGNVETCLNNSDEVHVEADVAQESPKTINRRNSDEAIVITNVVTEDANVINENDPLDEVGPVTIDGESINHESKEHMASDTVSFDSMGLKHAQTEQTDLAEALNEVAVKENIKLLEVPDEVEPIENKSENNVKQIDEVPKLEADIGTNKSEAMPTVIIEQVKEHSGTDAQSMNLKEEYPSDLNPFGEESDEEHSQSISKPVPSERRVSTNPFGSDDEEESQPMSAKPPRPPPPKIKTNVPANPFDDEEDDEPESEIVPVIVKPSPRRTPVPTPRKQHNHNDSISSMETSLMSSQFGGSNVSLASSLDSGLSTTNRRKKSKAPDIPLAITKTSTENLSSSQATTPRKKRPAPAPPVLSSTPKQSDSKTSSPNPTQRLITLDASLISNDNDSSETLNRVLSNDSVVYRRTLIPLKVDDDSLTLETSTTSERQWEKMKDNKEAQNRNRQSQISPISPNIDSYNSLMSNKSQQGKWKRRKGPAPALPVPLPERKAIKMLPLKEIRQEMDIIETQQQGLEKQGVVLEQMIRERCEGVGPEMDITGIQTNTKEVEDLIMQLFELVNEKNELFRRQAELMYLRRQHRLEQEQADLEYEIRLLMAQPERNKTDSDKEKEEALIARLVEIVQMRNEVVDCLEMDRLREAEEDMSIKQSIEERVANQQKHGKKDSDTEKTASGDSSMKLSKKEKKKLKEAKKLVKSKKIDSEKDADETENSTKEKKKKKKFFVDFLHHKS